MSEDQNVTTDIIPANNLPTVETAKRIIADAIRNGGEQTIIADATGRRHTYREYLALMLWDAIVMREVTFANGYQLKIDDYKDWLSTVRFLANHIDGGVIAENVGQVNIFKVYAGIDPSKV